MIGGRRDAAAAAGVSVASLQRYISEEVEAPFIAIARLARAARMSLDWIASGEARGRPEDSTGTRPAQSDEFVLVPRYSVGAIAGHGTAIHSEQIVDYLAFKREWLQREIGTTKELALVTAVGDSMEEDIHHGDLLMVRLDDFSVAKPGVFVIRYNNDETLLAKQIERQFDGTLVISSKNAAYRPTYVGPDDQSRITVVGRVVYVVGGRRL